MFLLSGPSGSGKDTVIGEVLRQLPELRFSISCITRPRRAESDDQKYRFVTAEEFKKGIREEAFLEYAEYCGNYYGTPAAPIDRWRRQGLDVLVECDTEGARQICRKKPEAISIFLMPPSFAVLHKRLTGRGTESNDQTARRLAAAVEEMKKAHRYQYVVVNDHLPDAVGQLIAILTAARCRFGANEEFINEVLQDAQSFHWEAHSGL